MAEQKRFASKKGTKGGEDRRIEVFTGPGGQTTPWKGHEFLGAGPKRLRAFRFFTRKTQPGHCEGSEAKLV